MSQKLRPFFIVTDSPSTHDSQPRLECTEIAAQTALQAMFCNIRECRFEEIEYELACLVGETTGLITWWDDLKPDATELVLSNGAKALIYDDEDLAKLTVVADSRDNALIAYGEYMLSTDTSNV